MAGRTESGPRRTWRYRLTKGVETKGKWGTVAGLGILFAAPLTGPFAPVVAGVGGVTTVVEGGQAIVAHEERKGLETSGRANKLEKQGTIFTRMKEGVKKRLPRFGTVYSSRNAALAPA